MEERPDVLPLPVEVLLLPEAADLLPPDEEELREELVLPEVALLSFAEVPLAPVVPLVLADVEVLEDVDLFAVPLPEDAGDFVALLEVVLLPADSLLELLSLGVPPVERFAALLLLDDVEPPLVEDL